MSNTKLENMVHDIESLAKDINSINIISKFDWKRLPEIYEWIKTPYYSCLAATAKIVNPNRILELGTFTGASALCLAYYGHKVDSYDIADKIMDSKIKDHFQFYKLSNPNDCTKLQFNDYELIFIDIGMHEGIYEKVIHEKLINDHYKGIVMWDDIFYNFRIKDLWNSIQCNKIETNWHPKEGFGVVTYD